MKFVFIFVITIHSMLAWSLVEKTIHIEGNLNSGRTWMDFSSSSEINLSKLFELLRRSSSGEKLLLKAQSRAAQSGLTLMDVIKVGDSSLTDTTLIRKFNPQSPEHVVYESRSVVYLNKNLSWDDALLDLAHELTHYVYRESFNPYSESFNASDFVKGTIEGNGGEVQAFLMECRILRELFSKKIQTRSQCMKIEDADGQLSQSKAIELFYHVGNYFDSFSQTLKGRGLDRSLRLVNGGKINFVSSAYGVPYPIAALMEFDLVLNKVCENDKKRLAYMQQGPQRGPASEKNQSNKFEKIYASRCSANN